MISKPTNNGDRKSMSSQKEIGSVCGEARDWQDAIEQLAETFPELEDDKIVEMVINHFFPKKEMKMA